MRNLWVWILLIAIFGSMFWYLNRERMGWGPESEYCRSLEPIAPPNEEALTRGESTKMRYNVGDRMWRFLYGCE